MFALSHAEAFPSIDLNFVPLPQWTHTEFRLKERLAERLLTRGPLRRASRSALEHFFSSEQVISRRMKLMQKTRPQLASNHIDANSLDLKSRLLILIQKISGVGFRQRRHWPDIRQARVVIALSQERTCTS